MSAVTTLAGQCGHRHPNSPLVCTLAAGHVGLHQAQGYDGRVLADWTPDPLTPTSPFPFSPLTLETAKRLERGTAHLLADFVADNQTAFAAGVLQRYVDLRACTDVLVGFERHARAGAA